MLDRTGANKVHKFCSFEQRWTHVPFCRYTIIKRCALSSGLENVNGAGVEHLLRDVKDSTVSNLSSEVSHMASGLRALKSRLSEVQEYLSLVLEGRLPVNHDIMYHLQVYSSSPSLVHSCLPMTQAACATTILFVDVTVAVRHCVALVTPKLYK